MQNLAGRLHVLQHPALQPHPAVWQIAPKPDELAVFPEFRDEPGVFGLGPDVHGITHGLGRGRISLTVMERILLVSGTEKTSRQQQAQDQSRRERADGPKRAGTNDGYKHGGIMNSGARDVKMIIYSGSARDPPPMAFWSVRNRFSHRKPACSQRPRNGEAAFPPAPARGGSGGPLRRRGLRRRRDRSLPNRRQGVSTIVNSRTISV